MKRRLILVISIVVVSLLVVLILVTKDSGTLNNPTEDQGNAIRVQGADQVIVHFSNVQYDQIKAAIEARIQANVTDAMGDYEINYREGSLKESFIDGYPIRRALFDIPKLERTFAVQTEGDETTDFSDVRVLCPQPNEMVYQPQKCNDTP